MNPSIHSDLQKAVILAAIAVCENAAYLPDGNAQAPTQTCESLGDCLGTLSDFEAELYADQLHPLETPIWGIDKQTGLNAAQIALQRLNMPEEQLAIERAIDMADHLYLGFFDQVVIPGVQYASLPVEQTAEVRYVSSQTINDFLHSVSAVKEEWLNGI